MSERSLQTGITLNGKYRIEKVLGEGNFGITYLGCNVTNNAHVVIKEYYPIQLVKRDMTGRSNSVVVLSNQYMQAYNKGVKRFAREAKAISTANNMGGVVAVRDLFYENNTAYMVMDYVDGVKLSDYLKRSRLGVDVCMQMFMPVINALDMVHKQGVLHRDINPDNFIVTSDNKLVLVDFGASRFLSINNEQLLARTLKPGYASVEQYCNCSPQGPWTDIYGLCATMLCAISGIVPDIATSRVSEDNLMSQIDELPLEDGVKKTLKKGLSVNADNRFGSMEEMYEFLYEGKQSAGLVKTLVIIVAALILVLAVVGGLLGWKAIKNKEEADESSEDVIELMDDDKDNSEDTSGSDENEDEVSNAPKKVIDKLTSAFEDDNKDQEIVYKICDDFDGNGSYEMYIISTKKLKESTDEKDTEDDKKTELSFGTSHEEIIDENGDEEPKPKDTDETPDTPEVGNDEDTADEVPGDDDASQPTGAGYKMWFVTEEGCDNIDSFEGDDEINPQVRALRTVCIDEKILTYVITQYYSGNEYVSTETGIYDLEGEEKAKCIYTLENAFVKEIDGRAFAMVQTNDNNENRVMTDECGIPSFDYQKPFLAYPLIYQGGVVKEIASVRIEQDTLSEIKDWEERWSEIEHVILKGELENETLPEASENGSVEISDIFYNDIGHIYINCKVKDVYDGDNGEHIQREYLTQVDIALNGKKIGDYRIYAGQRLEQGVHIKNGDNSEMLEAIVSSADEGMWKHKNK